MCLYWNPFIVINRHVVDKTLSSIFVLIHFTFKELASISKSLKGILTTLPLQIHLFVLTQELNFQLYSFCYGKKCHTHFHQNKLIHRNNFVHLTNAHFHYFQVNYLHDINCYFLLLFHCTIIIINISTFLRCFNIILITCSRIKIYFLFFNVNVMQDIWFFKITFFNSFTDFSVRLEYDHHNDFN